MLGKGQLSECYSTECSRGSNYKTERCILFEVRDICFLVLEYVHQRLVIFGMFLVNTKKGKRKACVCTELVVGGTGFLFQRAQHSDNWISTNLLSQGNLRIAIGYEPCSEGWLK